ncbi:MAG: hypothetical protein KIT15_16955 [Xanthobacteraceae bacterium]|nr:hypothetical protein [Xanthobacteraceae bacterium]
MASELLKFNCPKCNGAGVVSFKHIADGRCFLCQGSGKMVATKANLAKAAKMGAVSRVELPEQERCTIKQLAEISRLASVRRTDDTRLAISAGVPEVQAMDDWRYQLSRKQASKIIEYGRAA